MFTVEQLIAHAVGDYLIQSHWMANLKTRQFLVALLHGFSYTLPFMFITQSVLALAIIAGTHAVIDRWRLARWVCWAKNWQPNGRRIVWATPTPTGYPADAPAWLSTWLFIIADNLMHVTINAGAIKWL